MNALFTNTDALATGVLAVSTAVLVLVTAFYAWTTWRLLDEQKRDRQHRYLPRLRVLKMERVPKPPATVAMGEIKETDFYKVVLQNVGRGIAYVEGARMWDGQAPAGRDHEIDMLPASYKKVLFPEEKDVLAYYEHVPNGIGSYPTKVQVWYRDEFKRLIAYTARATRQIAEPTPYLAVRDYISHEYEGPEQKVAEYVPRWRKSQNDAAQTTPREVVPGVQ